jgi:predicted dehydrogenase
MHFALVGDHPDGLAFARTLVESGRHALVGYHGSANGREALGRIRPGLQDIPDFEELLADPRIEAVIVAGQPGDRAQQLRRALQSEHHVVCVHPADDTPNAAYEAAMIQQDTQRILLPLMPEALHPGVAHLAKSIRLPAPSSPFAKGEGQGVIPLGTLQLIEFERASPKPMLLDAGAESGRPALPGWDVLRALGGEIAEVSGLATGEHVGPEEPLVVNGRFDQGGLFQIRVLPGQPETVWRLTVIGKRARADFTWDNGSGSATLRWLEEHDAEQQQTWEAWNPWLAVLEVFEAAAATRPAPLAVTSTAASAVSSSEDSHPIGQDSPAADTRQLTWQTAIRSQELDDAVRRSVERRRTSTLEYPEATEEAGFKGTMTLVGCGLLWLVLLLVILSVWFPFVGWLVAPVLVFFLGLQILRWFVRRPNNVA